MPRGGRSTAATTSNDDGLIKPFICAICKKGFTRRATVKDPHFASCVRRNGNPDNVAWDNHPSCHTKLADGSKGLSGELPAGVAAALKKKEVW